MTPTSFSALAPVIDSLSFQNKEVKIPVIFIRGNAQGIDGSFALAVFSPPSGSSVKTATMAQIPRLFSSKSLNFAIDSLNSQNKND